MFGEPDICATVVVEVSSSLLNLLIGRALVSYGYFEHIHYRPNRAMHPR